MADYPSRDMDLHQFFTLNRQIIIFVYGLTFFVLGLSIALQSRRYSQLELARSLPWLAAFGFLHSLTEWGDLFIPIQSAYLAAPGLALLGRRNIRPTKGTRNHAGLTQFTQLTGLTQADASILNIFFQRRLALA